MNIIFTTPGCTMCEETKANLECAAMTYDEHEVIEVNNAQELFREIASAVFSKTHVIDFPIKLTFGVDAQRESMRMMSRPDDEPDIMVCNDGACSLGGRHE